MLKNLPKEYLDDFLVRIAHHSSAIKGLGEQNVEVLFNFAKPLIEKEKIRIEQFQNKLKFSM